MKRADLSNGLFVAGAHKIVIVDGQGVVVAQAPSGIHTQLGDVDWKRIAPILASSVRMLQELKRLADIAEDHREDVSEARKLIASAIQQAPELATILGVMSSPETTVLRESPERWPQHVKDLAYQLDPECWLSYSGQPRQFKRSMEARR